MDLTREDIDGLLVQRLAEIADAVAPRAVEQVLPEIHRIIAQRAHEVSDEKALANLVGAVICNAGLEYWAEAAAKDDGAAFDKLWDGVRPRLKGIIRLYLRDRDPYHVQQVESLVSETLWKKLKLKSYEPDRGSLLAWARGIARIHAMAYRPEQRWVAMDSVKEPEVKPEIEIPPSACFAEGLLLVQEGEPHMAIAFLYNKYLEWEPARIAGEFGARPLADLPDLLEAEVIARYPILAGIRGLLAPLRSRARSLADRRLADYCDGQLPECISRWSAELARSVALRIIRQAREFLELVCGLNAAAHERLSFLWCCFLRREPHRLCTMAHLLLLEILEIFRRDFPPMTHLKPEQVVRCTKPLEKDILPRKHLADCTCEELSAEIVRWLNKVRRMVLGVARDRRLLAYAYLCGCLPGVSV